MTPEQQQVKEWMRAFGQECPEKPTIPDLETRKLRAKLTLEEALEKIRALGFLVVKADCSEYKLTLQSWELIRGRPTTIEPNLLEIADGCEDLKVVTEGTLVACGLVKDKSKGYNKAGGLAPRDEEDPLFNEVMRSNFSKYWTTDEIKYHDNSPKPASQEHLGELIYVKFEYQGQELSAYRRDGERWLVKDSSGKVIKSPSFSPPNLQPIIDEMMK